MDERETVADGLFGFGGVMTRMEDSVSREPRSSQGRSELPYTVLGCCLQTPDSRAAQSLTSALMPAAGVVNTAPTIASMMFHN